MNNVESRLDQHQLKSHSSFTTLGENSRWCSDWPKHVPLWKPLLDLKRDGFGLNQNYCSGYVKQN